MSEAFPTDLLQSTLRNLRDHLQRLEADKGELERRIAEVRANIKSLEGQGGKDALVPVATNSTTDVTRQRRPRGENLRLVRELFAKNPEAEFTMQEIAQRTGVGVSSVQAVLNREGAGFHKTVDSKWQMEKEVELSAPTPGKPR